MNELELRQLFKNLSDCYVDVCEFKDCELMDAFSTQAMTEDRFIETIKQVKLFAIHSVSKQRELLFAYEKMRTSHITDATDKWRYDNVDLFLSNL